MTDYHAKRSIQLSGDRVVLTDQGTISGELEVGASEEGVALVRYAGTEEWFVISHKNDEDNKQFSNPEEIVTLIEGTEQTTDVAGNTQPFRL